MRLLQDLCCHLRTCGHTISGCEFHNAEFKDLEPFLRKLGARLLGEQISDRPRRQPLEIAICFAKASVGRVRLIGWQNHDPPTTLRERSNHCLRAAHPCEQRADKCDSNNERRAHIHVSFLVEAYVRESAYCESV